MIKNIFKSLFLVLFVVGMVMYFTYSAKHAPKPVSGNQISVTPDSWPLKEVVTPDNTYTPSVFILVDPSTGKEYIIVKTVYGVAVTPCK